MASASDNLRKLIEDRNRTVLEIKKTSGNKNRSPLGKNTIFEYRESGDLLDLKLIVRHADDSDIELIKEHFSDYRARVEDSTNRYYGRIAYIEISSDDLEEVKEFYEHCLNFADTYKDPYD